MDTIIQYYVKRPWKLLTFTSRAIRLVYGYSLPLKTAPAELQQVYHHHDAGE
jgi:hypothetical protein